MNVTVSGLGLTSIIIQAGTTVFSLQMRSITASLKTCRNREITALIIDPSAASFIQTVLRHGKFRVIKANNDVLTGINRVCQALKDEEIFIYPSCTDAIREFSIYRWDDNIKKMQLKRKRSRNG